MVIGKTVKQVVCAALIALSLFIEGCHGCPQEFHISGLVTDSNYNPLPGVQVILWNQVMATTISDGTYYFITNAGLAGEQLAFAKNGYSPYEAQPFTTAEAGSVICESTNLRRDAALSPQ